MSTLCATALFGASLAAAPPPPLDGRFEGVDLSTVEALKPPRVDGHTAGITADFKGGLVRVFVGPDDQSASWWVARMTTVVEKQKPTAVPWPTASAEPPAPDAEPSEPSLLDHAHELYRSDDRLVVLRYHNVGVMVEVSGGAAAMAETVGGTLLDDGEPWPEVPPLRPTSQGLQPHVDDPSHELRYEGGTLAPAPGLVFARPPRALIVYDTRGRSTRQAFDELGLVTTEPAPWADHETTQRPAPEESQ